jgi:CheY-like chemotaxis protein/signal transduction histidine kinase
MLRDFIEDHRAEILARARLRVAERNAPRATEAELKGLPLFLDQLREALRRSSSNEALDHAEIEETAGQHGRTLFEHGVTVAQVVHDYGDLCQVITGLAVDHHTSLDADEFRTLNLCLDDAIAGAVTEYSRLRERTISDAGTERLGFLAHEMRNVVNTSILTFGSIQKGTVAPGGSTGVVHARGLQRLTSIIDRSLADVRLDSGVQNVERVAVRDVLEEVEIGAAMVAHERGLRLHVTPADPSLIVEADRQILAAAVANLVQNALKFTQPGTIVKLGASATTDRVLISVQDECGGLPPGKAESLLEPFIQRSHDRSGLGLGLAICMKAAKAMAGELRIRDLPGEGCVFTLDLPKQPPPPTSIFDHSRRPEDGPAGRSGAALRGAGSSAIALLVDDEPQVAAAHARLLRRPGLHLEVCASPGRALDRIVAGERFDVVICDCRMRGLDGVELFRRARLVWPGLDARIIFLSGGLPDEDARFIREHALPLFAKPLPRGGDDLKAAVRALVDRGHPAQGEAPMTSGICLRASRAVTVLFVDDDEDALFAYQQIATEEGMTVALARDGQEAIALAGVLSPDVIVLDIGLSGLDGFEVARRLRAGPGTSAIPIVFLSGYSGARDDAALAASGCEGHLVKPCSAGALLGLVADVARSGRVPPAEGGAGARASSA